MKSMLNSAVVAAVLLAAAASAAHAESAGGPWPVPDPLLLAEDGSDRPALHRQWWASQSLQRARGDSEERFARMIKEQPTAAGPDAAKSRLRDEQPKSLNKSPLQRDREIYGSPK